MFSLPLTSLLTSCATPPLLDYSLTYISVLACLGSPWVFPIPFCFDCQSLSSARRDVPGFPQMLNNSSFSQSLFWSALHVEKFLAKSSIYLRHSRCQESLGKGLLVWTKAESLAPFYMPRLFIGSWRGLEEGNQDRDSMAEWQLQVWIPGIYQLVEKYFHILTTCGVELVSTG